MSVLAGYGEFERARRTAEPPKRTGGGARSEFTRDRARVLHSYAFRRLADKTQVVSPGEDDFPRTRLTHSLEVAQIGREIAAELGCDADLVDTACLAHDIGHPPFGHNGEHALDVAAASCGGFEGNAQTLRVLTRLEAKALDANGDPAGLNLTRAALDAVCKYPWPRPTPPQAGPAKFGYYAQDFAAFEWARAGTAQGLRCIEAQVMDWADDVAYSVHDVEDGVHAGLIRVELIDDAEREALCQLAAEADPRVSPDALGATLHELLASATLQDLAGYDGSYRAQAAAKRATSELTGRFVVAAVSATRERFGAGPLTRYAGDLVVPGRAMRECLLLKAVAGRYVMQRSGTRDRQAGQRVLLSELVTALADGAPDTLDVDRVSAWEAADDDADRLRVVIDQVAQLTDSTAVARHARLTGRGPGGPS